MGTFDQRDQRELSKGIHSSSGSFELVVAPLLMGWFGHWLDGRLGSGPWLLVVGVVLGFAGVAVKMYYVYQFKMSQHADDARAARVDRAAKAPADQAGELAARVQP